MSTDDMVAAFLAKGGKITTVPEGERAIPEKEMWDVIFNGGKARTTAQIEEQKLIDERHEVVDHRDISHFRNGLGEWIS